MFELYKALCLVLVIEGLILFAAPQGWQRLMREAAELDPRVLRRLGLGALVLGAILFRLSIAQA